MSAQPIKRERYTFYIDPDQRKGLVRIKEKEGISESEQIRRAIADWLKRKTRKRTT